FGEMAGYSNFPELFLINPENLFLQYSRLGIHGSDNGLYESTLFKKNRFKNKGLIPSFANKKDSFLNFLRLVNPEYVKKFRTIQRQDRGFNEGMIPNYVKVYHSTTKGFNKFTKGDIGFHAGTAQSANERL